MTSKVCNFVYKTQMTTNKPLNLLMKNLIFNSPYKVANSKLEDVDSPGISAIKINFYGFVYLLKRQICNSYRQ